LADWRYGKRRTCEMTRISTRLRERCEGITLLDYDERLRLIGEAADGALGTERFNHIFSKFLRHHQRLPL
jgi:hypothetical protein